MRKKRIIILCILLLMSINLASAIAIVGWGNTKTNDNTLSFPIYDGQTTGFNATANGPVKTWIWRLDDVDQNNNASTFTTKILGVTTHTVKVQALDSLGNPSNIVTWNVQAFPTPNIFIKEQNLETVNYWTCEVRQHDHPDYSHTYCGGLDTEWTTEKTYSYKFYSVGSPYGWHDLNDYAGIKQQVNIPVGAAIYADFRSSGGATRFYVTVDGTEVFSWSPTGGGYQEYKNALIDLSAYAGDNKFIMFRWQALTGSGSWQGWVDNIVMAPGFSSWSNSFTKDNSINVRVLDYGQSINFNATPTQTIQKWKWYKDGALQTNNSDNFTYTVQDFSVHTIKVSGLNILNGSTKYLVWTLSFPNSTLSDSGAKQTTTSENIYTNSLNISQTTQPHTTLTSPELGAILNDDDSSASIAGSASVDEFIYVNFSKTNVSSVQSFYLRTITKATADTTQIGLYNATQNGWIKVNSTSKVNEFVYLTYNITSQQDKDKYLTIDANHNLAFQAAVWTSGASASTLYVDYIQYTLDYIIYFELIGWSNSKTNDNSLDIGLYDGQKITFSATASDPVSTWKWYKNGVDQFNNAGSYATSFAPGNYTITVNATSTGGVPSTNTVVWEVEVKPTPDIFIKEQGFETLNYWTCEIYQNSNPDYIKYSCGNSTTWSTEKNNSYKFSSTGATWSWDNDYVRIKQQVNIPEGAAIYADFRAEGCHYVGCGYSSRRFSVRVDNTEIWSWSPTGPGIFEYKNVRIDLSPYAGNNRWLKIRWEVTSDPQFSGAGYVDNIVLAPSIHSQFNSLTDDNSTTLTDVDRGDTIKFNVTATQSIDQWKWYVDGVLQNNDYDNFTFLVQDFSVHIIKVSGWNKFTGSSNEISWITYPAIYHTPFGRSRTYTEYIKAVPLGYCGEDREQWGGDEVTGFFWHDKNYDAIDIMDGLYGAMGTEYYAYANLSNSTVYFNTNQTYEIKVYRTALDWTGTDSIPSKTKINTQLFIDDYNTPKYIWGTVIPGDVEPSIARDTTVPVSAVVNVKYNFTAGWHKIKLLVRVYRLSPVCTSQQWIDEQGDDRFAVEDYNLASLSEGKRGTALSDNVYATSLPGTALGTPIALTSTELSNLKFIDSTIVTQAGSASKDAYIIANLSLAGVDTVYSIKADTRTMISASDTTQIGLYNKTWNNWTKVNGTATVGSYVNLGYSFNGQDKVKYINPVNNNDKKVSLAFWSNGGSASTINADMMRLDVRYANGYRPAGYVKTAAGSPVEGIEVKLNSRTWQASLRTDSLGYYDFGAITDGWYDYNVSNPLNVIQFGRVKIRQGFPYLNFTLLDYTPLCTNTCYVAKNGSDSNTGMNWASAIYNINTAINIVLPNGTVRIGYGNYSDQPAIDGSKQIWEYWCDSSGYQENPAEPWCDMPPVTS